MSFQSAKRTTSICTTQPPPSDPKWAKSLSNSETWKVMLIACFCLENSRKSTSGVPKVSDLPKTFDLTKGMWQQCKHIHCPNHPTVPCWGLNKIDTTIISQQILGKKKHHVFHCFMLNTKTNSIVWKGPLSKSTTMLQPGYQTSNAPARCNGSFFDVVLAP